MTHGCTETEEEPASGGTRPDARREGEEVCIWHADSENQKYLEAEGKAPSGSRGVRD